MREKLMKKLRDSRGETLTEVLVALLVAVLAGTMLVAMITTSTSATKASREAMSEYYKSYATTPVDEGGEGYDSAVVRTKTGSVQIVWEEPAGAGSHAQSVNVKYTTRKVVANSEVTSYEKQ